MSEVEDRIKAYALANIGLLLDNMIDDEKAKLSDDVKKEFADYIERFPLSGYNGNNSTENGDISGR